MRGNQGDQSLHNKRQKPKYATALMCPRDMGHRSEIQFINYTIVYTLYDITTYYSLILFQKNKLENKLLAKTPIRYLNYMFCDVIL